MILLSSTKTEKGKMLSNELKHSTNVNLLKFEYLELLRGVFRFTTIIPESKRSHTNDVNTMSYTDFSFLPTTWCSPCIWSTRRAGYTERNNGPNTSLG